MNQLKVMCHDMSELLFLHNIFMLKKLLFFFFIRMALKTLRIIKSLSVKVHM